jgi:hypothetical protein
MSEDPDTEVVAGSQKELPRDRNMVRSRHREVVVELADQFIFRVAQEFAERWGDFYELPPIIDHRHELSSNPYTLFGANSRICRTFGIRAERGEKRFRMSHESTAKAPNLFLVESRVNTLLLLLVVN